jgi:transposase
LAIGAGGADALPTPSPPTPTNAKPTFAKSSCPARTCPKDSFDETAAHRRDPVADPDGRAVAGHAPAYGPWQTVYGLSRRWQRNGTWRKILTGLQGRGDAAGLITWDVPVVSTVARAHQHAAGARKNGICRLGRSAGPT